MAEARESQPQQAAVDIGVLLGYPSDRRAQVVGLVLGDGARLRSGTVLYDGSRIGARFSTGHHVVVREDCTIGDDVSVWTGSVVDYGCTIGHSVKVHANCYVAQFTTLEDGAFLAPGVSFANDVYPGREDSAQRLQGPRVGARAQLGVNVTVLPYVRIGAEAVIGAGSVVTRDVPPGMLAYGSPAVPVRPVAELPAVEQWLRSRRG